MRTLIGLTLMWAFASAYADETQEICDGRYTYAAKQVNRTLAKYGSLYSGGVHWHRVDNISKTINLYRLWKGLPLLNMNTESRINTDEYLTENSPIYSWANGGLKEDIAAETIRNFLWVGSELVGEHTEEDQINAVIALDFLTAIGDPLDWWLQKDYFAKDTPIQNKLIPIFQESEFFNWLQFAATASNTPWSIAWHLESEKNADHLYTKFRDESLNKYHKTGAIEWAVMALLFQDPKAKFYDPRSLPYYRESKLFNEKNMLELRNIFIGWTERVLACEATEQEYAAWAITSTNFSMWVPKGYSSMSSSLPVIELNDTFYNYLPEQSSIILIRNLIWQSHLGNYYTTYHDGNYYYTTDQIDNYYKTLPETIKLPELKSWINTAQAYTKNSVEGLIDLYNGQVLSKKAIRILNLLSTKDLHTFLSKTELLDAEETRVLRKAMAQSLFARYVTLGQYQEALSFITQLKQILPELALPISEIEQRKVPLEVKLAMIVIDNPNFSTWIKSELSSDPFGFDFGLWLRESSRNQSRELPAEIASGMAIQGDYETWLRLPQKWGRYHGLRGGSIPELERNNNSHSYMWDKNTNSAYHQRYNIKDGYAPLLFAASPYDYTKSLDKLIARNELNQLTDHIGLTNQMSRIIINWVKSEHTSWFSRVFNKEDHMAEYLHKIVFLNRYNYGGEIDNKPSGQLAFKLLHKYFPDSEWAKKTPYWYKPK